MGYLISLADAASGFREDVDNAIAKSGSRLYTGQKVPNTAMLFLLMDEMDARGEWVNQTAGRLDDYLKNTVPDFLGREKQLDNVVTREVVEKAIPKARVAVNKTLDRIIPGKTWHVWTLRPIGDIEFYLRQGEDVRELERYRQHFS